MLRVLTIGIWMAAVTAGSSYGAVYWMTHMNGIDPADIVLEGLDYEKTRLIYEDCSLDFKHLERYDLEILKKEIRERVNKRMRGPFIHEILMEEFDYFSKEDVISN
ncbi:hypothetical protein [Breoghania sp.]|uniref:hypothetical protein n=1 Tax=Breoghania sp. TaxID=2065378 RepID=UPI00262D8FBF|nr:hypothetical protein [Breoghania sp.]MDJ0929495.1 hypothetical protein [Breoghania sp.]